MDPNSDIGKWLHIIFGLLLLLTYIITSEVDDSIFENLMSIQTLS